MLLLLFPGLKKVSWSWRGQIKIPFKISIYFKLSTITLLSKRTSGDIMTYGKKNPSIFISQTYFLFAAKCKLNYTPLKIQHKIKNLKRKMFSIVACPNI